jgi:hypothetical protein
VKTLVPLLALLLLSACARVPRGANPQRFSDLDRALAVMLSDAEQELLKEGTCAWRLYVRCADGFALAAGGRYSRVTEYFDAHGEWMGSETSDTCRLPQSKGCRRCEKPQAEFLCPRVLARVQRVEATIRYHATELRLAEDTEVDANDFRGVINFSADATQPISVTITEVAAGKEIRVFPFLDDGFGLDEPRSDEGTTVELGKPTPLPARIYVNGYPRIFAVHSRYVRIAPLSPAPLPASQGEGVRSRSASAEPAAR